MEPIRSPDEQAAADRASRRRMAQAWLTALVVLGIAALKIWGHHEAHEVLPNDAHAAPLQTGPWVIWAAAFPLIWLATTATRGFTFSFSQPIWRGLELRLTVCQLALLLSAVLATFPFLPQIGSRLGLPRESAVAIVVPIGLIVYLLSQLLIASVCRAALVERLRAKGVVDELGQGTLVTLKRLPRGMQRYKLDWDAGHLWMEGRSLRFEGDLLSVRADPGGAVKLSREIVPGTLAALLGQRGIILTLPSQLGAVEVSVRPIDAWPSREETERIALQMAAFTA